MKNIYDYPITEETPLGTMYINDDGEGEINGKTIREVEREKMEEYYLECHKDTLHNYQSKKNNIIIKFFNTILCFIQKIIRIIVNISKNYFELLIALLTVIIYIYVYLYCKSPTDGSFNGGLLGGLLSGMGAIVAILISIIFSRLSNNKIIEMQIKPYILLQKVPITSEYVEAFKYDNSLDFSAWIPFKFDEISNNKRACVREGIILLNFQNIGIGTAKNIEVSIQNFGNIFYQREL